MPEKPAGQWNAFRLECEGPKVLVHINDMRKILAKLIPCVLVWGCLTPVGSARDVEVRNLGAGGANSRDGLARLPKVLAGKPEHLVIFFGMNDAVNDSLTFGSHMKGEGTATGETYPAVLARKLTQKGAE